MTSNKELPLARKKRGKFLTLTKKKAISGWLFVLPFIIGILFIYAPIVFKSVEVSFSAVDVGSGANRRESMDWVGFANYKSVFESDKDSAKQYIVTVVDGLKDLIIQIPAIVIFSLFMAIILNQKMPGRTVFRAIFFLPVILSTGVIAAIDSAEGSVGDLMNNNTVDANVGEESFMSAMDIEALLSNMELGSGLVDIVVGLVNNIFDIISRSGVQMLIFLSGLQSISPSIYESCHVEGASAWETFWKITLPMVSPMILVNSIYTVIDAFTSVDNRVMSNVYSELQKVQDASAIQSGHAMAWLYIALVLVVILLVGLLMKAFVFYQKRD